MNSLIFTIDIDWASEAAIEETLLFFYNHNIKPTIFNTHHSRAIEKAITSVDIGLHPFFGHNSSHGRSINEVVKFIKDLPHNINAFRCHRFGACNESKQAMLKSGMEIISNVCTNLELLSPFRDRSGLIEYPIFLEDGAYLWHKYPLEITHELEKKLTHPTPKVIVVHPMHLVLNTPNFDYMVNIKNSSTRESWNTMNTRSLDGLRFKGRGVRDFIEDLIAASPQFSSLRELHRTVLDKHNSPLLLPE